MFQQPAGLDGPRAQSYGSPRSRGGPRGMGAQMSYNPYNAAAAGSFNAPAGGQMGPIGGVGGEQFGGGAPPMQQRQQPPQQFQQTQGF